MQRNDVLRELASRARHDPWVALFALGYLACETSTEVLSDLLEACQEKAAGDGRGDHLEAYRERWGRLPDEVGR